MIRDPLYTTIVDALARLGDGDQFELCAADLLRDAFPDLVPIVGGHDDGMDGTFGEDGLLIATIRCDVIGNLTANLTRHRDTGGRRRRVLVATSQSLSPRRKRNLDLRAHALGFELIQVFDQPAIALRLLRDSRWRMSLLGIGGDLEVLSKTPPRPQIVDQAPVERREAADWLKSTGGDLVLVGGPGSGKTTLLEQLVATPGYFFLTSRTEDAIADAVRAKRPTGVIVDDAHFELATLGRLVRLRRELGTKFVIVASTWHGAADDVRTELLNVPTDHIYELPPMPRDALVEVVKSVGIHGPVELVRRIVDQSANQPGLAVILGQAALQGDGHEVVTGRTLLRYIMTWLKRVADSDSLAILGAFALGGRSGMELADVANILGLSLVVVQQALKNATAAGIMFETPGRRLAVRSRALRGGLVAETFFVKAGPRLPYRPILSLAPNADHALESILSAAHSGAPVDDGELRDLVAQSASSLISAWYAALGPNESAWVLADRGMADREVARTLLQHVPTDAIPLLLDAVRDDQRLPQSAPDHPLRVLQDWVGEIAVPGTQMLERRDILVRAARRWQQRGGDSTTAVRATCTALSPGIEGVSADPGAGNTITFLFGVVSPEIVQGIAGLWDMARDTIRHEPGAGWPAVLELLWEWEHPGSSGPALEVPDETTNGMRVLGRRAVAELAEIAADYPGLLATLKRHAEELEVNLPVGREPDFSILFPQEARGDDWQPREEEQTEAVRQLAREWCDKPVGWIRERLVSVESEAALAAITFPRFTPLLCRELAANRTDSVALLHDLEAAEVSADLLEPFLSRLDGVQKTPAIAHLLGIDRYRYLAVGCALQASDLPDPLHTEVMDLLPEYAHLVYIMCLRQVVPEARVGELLNHPYTQIALAAAVGEWCGAARRQVRQGLKPLFRAAILRAADLQRQEIRDDASTGHWLADILKNDAELAADWLDRRLGRGEREYFLRDNSPQAAAASALTADRRRTLIRHEGLEAAGHELAALLVGGSPEFYAELLARGDLPDHHLAALAGSPDDAWIARAKLALANGYSPDQIVRSILGNSLSWSGSEAAYWQTWVDKFSALAVQVDADTRRLGTAGVEHFARLSERAAARERREALGGLAGDI